MTVRIGTAISAASKSADRMTGSCADVEVEIEGSDSVEYNECGHTSQCLVLLYLYGVVMCCLEDEVTKTTIVTTKFPKSDDACEVSVEVGA